MSALGAQVSELRAINETLKKYLEAVMKGITPADSNRLIQSEERRLQELERKQRIKENPWSEFVMRRGAVPFEEFEDAMTKATSFSDFVERLKTTKESQVRGQEFLTTLKNSDRARRDFNQVRSLLGQRALRLRQSEHSEPEEQTQAGLLGSSDKEQSR